MVFPHWVSPWLTLEWQSFISSCTCERESHFDFTEESSSSPSLLVLVSEPSFSLSDLLSYCVLSVLFPEETGWRMSCWLRHVKILRKTDIIKCTSQSFNSIFDIKCDKHLVDIGCCLYNIVDCQCIWFCTHYWKNIGFMLLWYWSIQCCWNLRRGLSFDE